MNLDNWQRRELIGATYSNAIVTRYYGYSNVVNAADTDEVFSIKKITVSGTVETVTWNDNSFTSFNAKWSERAANFTAPSGSLGFTFSVADTLQFSWTRLAGTNTYNIIVTDQDGTLYNEMGNPITGPNAVSKTSGYINRTSHTQRLHLNGTYSIVLQAVNAGGTLTAIHSYAI